MFYDWGVMGIQEASSSLGSIVEKHKINKE